jgi:3-dehydroquinate synthase
MRARTGNPTRMIRVRVPGRTARYPVRVERGLLARAGLLLRAMGTHRTAVLVTDATVGRLYGALVASALSRGGYRVRVYNVPDGERAKSFPVFRRLCEAWARDGITRDAVVVALGGGVVSDLAGFAAASFYRGLDWAVLPTTLLAQADAAIGGKVAIDLETGKNLVGAYHHPLAVFADPDALATLPARAYRAGFAEIVKMGVVARPSILDAVARLARRGGLGDPSSAAPLVLAAAAEKANLVGKDERDQGVRRHLNFGHTVGHALETAYGYRRFLHGEAVSVGMVAALRLSVLEAGLDPVDAVEVETLLRSVGLPTSVREVPDRPFWDALGRDKKRGRAKLRVVLCPAIGKAKVFEMSSLTTLRRVVRSLTS